MSNIVEYVEHEGKTYCVSNEPPENGDLVLTDKCGVWEFRNDAPRSDRDAVCYAPLPYWANKNTCKKLIKCNAVLIFLV